MKRAYVLRLTGGFAVAVAWLMGAAAAQEALPLLQGSRTAFVDWANQFVGVNIEIDAPSTAQASEGLKLKYRESEAEFTARIEERRQRLAQEAALAAAREKALPVLLGLRLDSRYLVYELEIAETPERLLGPKAALQIVRAAWHERPEGASFEADVKVPLWDGKEGSIGAKLLALALPDLGEPPAAVQECLAKRRRFRSGERIVFDARAVHARPALFPTVQTDAGAVVYNAKAVHRKDLLEYGVGAYHTLAADAPIVSGDGTGRAIVTVVTVASVRDDQPSTLIVRAADAAELLADERRVMLLVSGRVQFVLSDALGP